METQEPLAERRYHHGDLRAALLRAAGEELTAAGVEGFSLRQVARRAGVSHAAPAHHFGDVTGLLTALAAEAFRRLLGYQTAREAGAEGARARLIAAGLGYVDFAMAEPAMFRLMFASKKPDFASEDLASAAGAAYGHLVERVTAAGGQAAPDKTPTADTAAVWAAAHGIAELIQAPPMDALARMTPEERDAILTAVFERALPG